MNTAQRHAWYNLGVVVLTMVVVVALVPVMGRGAQGGFGLLGLLGFGPLFYWRKGGVVMDERDMEISRRSLLIAYVVFWLAFVAACVSLPAFYGWDGAVPVVVVMSSVFLALMLVTGVTSVATLVQYSLGGKPDAARV
jgi:hypothetical protein